MKTQEEILNFVWTQTILEYTKEWFITEDEVNHLRRIFNDKMNKITDVYLKEEFENE